MTKLGIHRDSCPHYNGYKWEMVNKSKLIKKIDKMKIPYKDRRNEPYNEGYVDGYNEALEKIKAIK